METTKRTLWALLGLAVCGCLICGPVPPPQPIPEEYWDPVGAAVWPTGAVQLQIQPMLQQGFAGQGAEVRHLELDFSIAREVFASSVNVRILMLATRADGTTVFRNSALRTLSSGDLAPQSDAGYVDQVIARVCPARDTGKVIGEPIHFVVQFARESDRQLLQRVEVDVTPVCSGSCPCQ